MNKQNYYNLCCHLIRLLLNIKTYTNKESLGEVKYWFSYVREKITKVNTMHNNKRQNNSKEGCMQGVMSSVGNRAA